METLAVWMEQERCCRIRLEHLFLAGMWMQKSEPQAMDVLAYKKLAEFAERTSVDVWADLCAAA